MNRHKWFVAMSAMTVAFFVWVNPTQGIPEICCMDRPNQDCCGRTCECAPGEGCGGCDAMAEGGCELVGPCCNHATRECFEMNPDCCEALGYAVLPTCYGCGWEPEGHPGDDQEEAAKPTADEPELSSVWVLVVAALLLLPAVPLVMRRRAARQG